MAATPLLFDEHAGHPSNAEDGTVHFFQDTFYVTRNSGARRAVVNLNAHVSNGVLTSLADKGEVVAESKMTFDGDGFLEIDRTTTAKLEMTVGSVTGRVGANSGKVNWGQSPTTMST